jgi:hypothetical protein
LNFQKIIAAVLYATLAIGLLYPQKALNAQEMLFHLLGMGPRFDITGITGNNGQDTTIDANLNYDTAAIVSWQPMTGATSYDVAIYQDDKSTFNAQW